MKSNFKKQLTIYIMNENFDETPNWAKELINTVKEMAEKVNKTFPDEEKKHDFSKLRNLLDMDAIQLKDNKTK